MTFRTDHSERWCRRFHYCLPNSVHDYDGENLLVVRTIVYKVVDERIDLMPMN